MANHDLIKPLGVCIRLISDFQQSQMVLSTEMKIIELS